MPELILLGGAQDGGVPQAGCNCAACARAHESPEHRQFVSCVGLVRREDGGCWMVDATPDFREQLYLLTQHSRGCQLRGILMTHAHMGHYIGLAHLGREAMNADHLPVYGTPAMGAFLRNNGPWSQLIDLGNIDFRPIKVGVRLALSPALTVVPIEVAHRSEFSDAVSYLIQGPSRTAFYCPDVDGWDGCSFRLDALLQEVDLALLDGTSFDGAELPGRDRRQIPHPSIRETVSQLAGVRAEVCFIHLNHTNPLWRGGPVREWLEASGYSVGIQGQSWSL